MISLSVVSVLMWYTVCTFIIAIATIILLRNEEKALLTVFILALRFQSIPKVHLSHLLL